MVCMSTKLERDLFELKMSKRESKSLIESLGMDLELVNSEDHLEDWAKQYVNLLIKISEAHKLVSQLELEKHIYEKYLLGSFELKEVKK